MDQITTPTAYGTEYEGSISINTKGFGYVRVLGIEKGIEIPQHELNTALHGDVVKARITGKNKFGQFAGEVLSITRRSKHGFAGIMMIENNIYYVRPQDARMYADIIIPRESLNGAELGQKVFVKITDWSDSKKSPNGEVHTVLGRPGENDAEVSAYALERGFDTSFPKDVKQEARLLGERGIIEEDFVGRRDFRKVLTCTIDPADAKDFDDALSFQVLPNGNYEIGIHIADVSHYVREGTALDREARARATSVYMVDRVIPMLPEVLSNDLCSLVEKQNRLTFGVVFEMNDKAEIISEWFGKTIIFSDKRLSYEEAQTILDTKEGRHFESLDVLNTIAKIMQKERFEHGALSLETEEVKFILDKTGFPTGVYKKVRGDTHKMIEEWMLLANKGVAKFVATLPEQEKHVFVYRVHDEPEKEKMLSLATIFRNTGHPVRLVDGIIPSQDINKVLWSLEGSKEANLLQSYTTRSMQKALYTVENRGHYGLAFEYYSHFTSPIRRYPDTLVHRLLTKYLQQQTEPIQSKGLYMSMCEHCSFREKEAADAERGSIKYKQVQYMSIRIGQTFDGIVSGVSQWGLYVEDIATKCEGMLRLRDLGSDFYVYDDARDCILGENTGEILRMGDELKIKVKTVNLEERLIDYERVLEK